MYLSVKVINAVCTAKVVLYGEGILYSVAAKHVS